MNFICILLVFIYFCEKTIKHEKANIIYFTRHHKFDDFFL